MSVCTNCGSELRVGGGPCCSGGNRWRDFHSYLEELYGEIDVLKEAVRILAVDCSETTRQILKEKGWLK